MKLFSNTEVNTGRQPELDMAKGFAIVAMIICHTVLIYAMNGTGPGAVIADKVLGGPIAAPLFMIAMGIGICYSRHSSSLEMVRRGFGLLVSAYLLNLVRGGIPVLFGSLVMGREVMSPYVVWAVMVGDILQFAGLAFMFLGVAKKMEVSDLRLALIAIICAVIGGVCTGYDTGNDAVNALFGLFFAAGDAEGLGNVSAFPFLNWIIFPVFGLVFGKMLRRCNDTSRFYAIITAITLPLTMFYVWYSSRHGFFPFSEGHYFWPTLVESMFFISLDLLIIAIFFWLSKILPVKIFQPLTCLSRNINSVYCISWVIICWTGLPIVFLLDYALNPWYAYPIGIAIAAISYYLAKWWNGRKS